MKVLLLEDQFKTKYVQSKETQVCPKCGGVMKTIPVDIATVYKTNSLGGFRCTKCFYYPDYGILYKDIKVYKVIDENFELFS